MSYRKKRTFSYLTRKKYFFFSFHISNEPVVEANDIEKKKLPTILRISTSSHNWHFPIPITWHLTNHYYISKMLKNHIECFRKFNKSINIEKKKIYTKPLNIQFSKIELYHIP